MTRIEISDIEIMKSILKISVILMLILASAAGMYAQEKAPDIELFAIAPETINRLVKDTAGHKQLTEDNGYVLIPNTFYKHDGTSDGIIVVHSNDGAYVAFERSCPRCRFDFHQSGKIYFPNSFMAACSKCDARLESILFWGSGQMFYDCGAGSPRYLISYPVSKYVKDGRLYLIINKSRY